MIHSRKKKPTFYSPITFLLVLLTLFSLTVVYDSNHIISTLSSLVLRRRMEPPTTPSPVSVKLALPKREEMYKTRVAICALSKSKPTWQYVHDTSVYNLFLAGIHRTTRMHTQYDIQIHIGVDADDVFWSKKDNFNALVLASARAFDLKVTVHHYDKKQPNHLPMNELMRDAARAGAEYLVRLNDDTEIRSMSWLPLAVHQLSAYDPPNVGVVGPVCREGKTSILTHDMVHRTHLEIFDTYYPPNFHNWYVDDWISAVYGPERTTKIPDWVVHHYVSPPRYNPIMVSNETLQASIREGKHRIQAYLSRRNVSRKLSQVSLREKVVTQKTFAKQFKKKKHVWLSQKEAFEHETSVLTRLNSVTPPCGESHVPKIVNVDETRLILTIPWYGTSLNDPNGMKQFCEMEWESVDTWAKCVDDHLAVANVSYHDHHGSGQNLVISDSKLTLIDFGIADIDNQKRLPSKYLNHTMSTRELTREIYKKHCAKSRQSKSAAIFIFADNKSAEKYAPNINSFRCYVSLHTDYRLVVMSMNDKRFLEGCSSNEIMFVRHCMLSNFMAKHPHIHLFLAIDADNAVIDISRRLETFAVRDKDITFQIRFHNGEISANYLVRNTEYSRDFLHKLGNMKWNMNSDNGALHQLILARTGDADSCLKQDTYLSFLKCFHKTVGDSDCHHDFWKHHAAVLHSLQSFQYDGWLTKYQYSPKTFIHHAMKNPPIGGNNHGRIFPDVLENGCKMPDNDPYRISPEQEDHLLRERIDSIQSIWNANGLYNTSCILFKALPTSPATASRSTRVWEGR